MSTRDAGYGGAAICPTTIILLLIIFGGPFESGYTGWQIVHTMAPNQYRMALAYDSVMTRRFMHGHMPDAIHLVVEMPISSNVVGPWPVASFAVGLTFRA